MGCGIWLFNRLFKNGKIRMVSFKYKVSIFVNVWFLWCYMIYVFYKSKKVCKVKINLINRISNINNVLLIMIN